VSKVSNALDFNTATLSGCIDIIVVELPDGSYRCSPFHVRFGKIHLLKSREKIVQVTVNDKEMSLSMKLGSAGEAFFVREAELEEDDEDLLTSPITSSPSLSPRMERDDINTLYLDDSTAELTTDLGTEGDSERPDELSDGGFLSDEDSKVDFDLLQASPNDIADQLLKKGMKDEEKRAQLMEEEDASRGTRRKTWKWTWGQPLTKDEHESHQKATPSTEETSDGPSDEGGHRPEILPEEDEDEERPKEPKTEFQEGESSTEPNLLKADSEDSTFSQKNILQSGSSPIKNENDEAGDSPRARRARSDSFKEGDSLIGSLMGMFSKDSPEKEGNGENDQNTQDVPHEENTGGETKEEVKENEETETEAETEEKPELRDHHADEEISTIEPSSRGMEAENMNGQEEEEARFNSGYEDEDESDLELSICAHLLNENNEHEITEIFAKNRVRYDQFCEDPYKILSNKNLLLRIEDQIFDWRTAAPLVVSHLAFRQPLPAEVMTDLFRKEKKRGWFDWLRTNRGRQRTESDLDRYIGHKTPIRSQTDYTLNVDDASPGFQEQNGKPMKTPPLRIPKKFKKVVRPTSDQLKSMDLQPGRNSISFSVNSRFQGRQTICSSIYLWNYDSKVVVSDVDGTITKSDVLGQLLPAVGKDWSHQGVTSLYSNVVANGYKILYLTSRAIGQADQTRNYLHNLTKDEQALPIGPVVMSPDRLLRSFKREVILRRPQIFKIEALRDIRNLFPDDRNPFYSGFGNRDTDAMAYRAVGIPLEKVYIINPQGQIHHVNSTYSKSYPMLNEMVDEMFPPVRTDGYDVDDAFNNSNFWRQPGLHLNDIDYDSDDF